MDLETASMLAGLVVALLGIAGYVLGWYGKLSAWVRDLRARLRGSSTTYDIPTRTLILQPRLTSPFWWHMGKSLAGKPAMQIVGDLNATNISKWSVFVMSAKMRKPKATGGVMVLSPKTQMFGSNHVIESGHFTEVHFYFWLVPPVRDKGKTFTADVAIIDQFGNEHWLKKVEFEYR